MDNWSNSLKHNCWYTETFLTVFYFYVFQELTSICNPIVTKPKPKVELPKEEQKPTEPNGPVEGQGEANGGSQAAEQSAAAAPTATEKKLPEMDID